VEGVHLGTAEVVGVADGVRGLQRGHHGRREVRYLSSEVSDR
jgi:hypothetical protein